MILKILGILSALLMVSLATMEIDCEKRMVFLAGITISALILLISILKGQKAEKKSKLH